MPRLDADWMPDGVPVFATPEDMMKSGEDGVLHGASAVRVPSGTRIRLVCAGLGYHGVRIAEGPHRGRFGWTPDQWIAGADGRKLLSDEHLRAGLHRALGIE